MPAYCFFDVRQITDQEKVSAYRARVVETVEKHGGRYLVLGGRFDVMEGDWQPVIPVIIEFPSLDAAQRWYASDDYAPLKALRLEGTVSCGVFIEGVDATLNVNQ